MFLKCILKTTRIGKSVIVMFKDDTPKDVIDKAAADVVKQGKVYHLL